MKRAKLTAFYTCLQRKYFDHSWVVIYKHDRVETQAYVIATVETRKQARQIITDYVHIDLYCIQEYKKAVFELIQDIRFIAKETGLDYLNRQSWVKLNALFCGYKFSFREKEQFKSHLNYLKRLF